MSFSSKELHKHITGLLDAAPNIDEARDAAAIPSIPKSPESTFTTANYSEYTRGAEMMATIIGMRSAIDRSALKISGSIHQVRSAFAENVCHEAEHAQAAHQLGLRAVTFNIALSKTNQRILYQLYISIDDAIVPERLGVCAIAGHPRALSIGDYQMLEQHGFDSLDTLAKELEDYNSNTEPAKRLPLPLSVVDA